MSDDKSNRGPQDRNRININEDYEVRYWTKELDVDEDLLKEVVREAGPMVDDVLAILSRLGQGQQRKPAKRASPTKVS